MVFVIDLSKEFHPVPKVFKVKKQPKPLKQVGKKTQESLDNVAERKKEFEAAGIVECEIKFIGCWKNNALSFAHGKKRRHLTKEELKKVILACVPCHTVIEQWKEDKMEKFVDEVIIKRVRQP